MDGHSRGGGTPQCSELQIHLNTFDGVISDFFFLSFIF